MPAIRFLRNTKRNNQKYKKISNTSNSLTSRWISPQREEVLCRGAEFSEKMLEDCLELMQTPPQHRRTGRKKGLSDTDANSHLTSDKSTDRRVLSIDNGHQRKYTSKIPTKNNQNSVSLSGGRCGKRRDFCPKETFATCKICSLGRTGIPEGTPMMTKGQHKKSARCGKSL